MNREEHKSSIFIVSPRSVRWPVHQFSNDLSAIIDTRLEVLSEKGAQNSFYDEKKLTLRENAFSIQENSFETLKHTPGYNDTVIIPLVYPYPNTSAFIDACRYLEGKGVRIVSVLFEALAVDEMIHVIELSHKVIVFDSQDRFLLVGKNIVPEKISILPVPGETCEAISEKKSEYRIITIPDTGLSRNEYEDIIRAAYAVSEFDSKIRIQLVRTPQNYNSGSLESGFPKDFVDTIELRGLTGIISLYDSNVSLANFRDCIQRSNFIVLSGAAQSSILERRSIVAIALQSNVPVLRSITTGVTDIDAVTKQMTAYRENSIGRAILEIHENTTLVSELKSGMNEYKRGAQTKDRYLNLVESIKISGNEQLPSTRTEHEDSPVIALQKPMPRILLKNRANAFTHPGGDTVIMKRLLEGLENEGFDVSIDLEEKEDVEDYDLVHLFNFAIKEVTEAHARDCVRKGIPYVVTTLYEDWPKFYNQMAQMYIALDAYVKHGQPSDRWHELESAAREVTPSAAWDNTFSALNAECLIATGHDEAQSLIRDYPSAKQVMSIPLGCEVSETRDGGKLFREKYGLESFIFCVGRLEWRKNQLMLLKALEHTNDTIVFAASGFTYQPDYEALCKSFKRKGRTVFLERLTAEELASAYQAAGMHVLPSWFELPGLVSLEAGRYGTPLVVSDTGSTRSYAGTFAQYCSPDSVESIRSAIEVARGVTNRKEIAAYFSQYTWEASVKKHAEMYESVLSGIEKSLSLSYEIMMSAGTNTNKSEFVSEATTQLQGSTSVNMTTDDDEVEDTYESLCKEGDIALASGKKELAMESFKKAIRMNPSHPRAIRSLGAVHYYSGSVNEAAPLFSQALALDPKDVKSMLGKGAVLWEKGEKENAYVLYKQAADMSPGDTSVVLYMVNASYELEKYKVLEDTLRSYLRIHPEDNSIQYCLAGCYFKQKNFSAASGVIERILSIEPDHSPSLELKAEIEKVLSSSDRSAVSEVSTEKRVEEVITDSGNDKIIIRQNASLKNTPVSESTVHAASGSKEKTEKDKSLGSKIEFVNNSDATRGKRELRSGKEEILQLESLKREKRYSDLLSKAEDFLSVRTYEEQARVRIVILKAEAMGFLGKVEEAKKLLRKLLSEGVTAPRVYSGIGALEASAGNWQAAFTYFEKSLMDHPAMDVPLAGLGICARAMGQLEQAWNYFTESAKRNPENTHAIFGLVDLAYELKRLDGVEGPLREYLEHKPVDLNMLYSLAGCLYAQGKTVEAIEELESILVYDPEHETARELLEKIRQPVSSSVEVLST
jgi:tetratricopeptide (TPR) repeat protein/glycosyltransferase involved in cell wall biosynthesis